MNALRKDLQVIADWIRPGSQVLDLGCGDGSLMHHLIESRGVSGYGIEIDADNITRSIQRGVSVIQTDLDRGLADFGADAFEYVVLSQTLQAIHHPERLLEEMLRVGREGIVTFPNFGHWVCRLQLGLTGFMPMSRALPHMWYNTPNIRLCTLNDFERLCRDKGIRILERCVLDRTHRQSWAMGVMPNLLAEIALYRFEQAR